ncbi:MAG: sigma 54-interacting transcriptional regulator, partial [Acidobacteria bacterium]|nr:sigma 54-interacting transcriptional regulator [Acidobacteriota bacterium]
VLVLGETGTGKELFARLIHAKSHRREEAFVAVNCAAIVETLLEAELFGIEDRTATGVRGRRGKFEEAQGGTLFLDEVGDLSKAAQAKLLRVLQDLTIERVGSHQSRRVDVRVVAATNQSLADLVARRRFRADLFHRLSGLDVALPPLRERGDDVIELAHHLLQTHAPDRPLRFTTAAEDALRSYPWPGNVRELDRVIQHLLVFVDGDQIGFDQLPNHINQNYREIVVAPALRGESLRTWTSRLCRFVVETTGNKSEACRQLHISFHTLQNHLRKTPLIVSSPPPSST